MAGFSGLLSKKKNQEKEEFVSPADVKRKLAKLMDDYEAFEEFLEIVELKISNSTMDDANRIFREKWIKIKYRISYFHLYSESEIFMILYKYSKKGILSRICSYLKELLSYTKILSRYIDMTEGVIDVAGNVNSIYLEEITKTAICSGRSDKYANIRSNMNAAISQFSACIGIVECINMLSIPGIREYVDYILTVYRKSEKIFKIVRKYADKIHKTAGEAQRAHSAAINNPCSVWSAFNRILIGEPTNDILDTMIPKK